ncbi:uncharacterized protein LOC123977590 isoform X2 [Micropterus dolomieu]|uniref:uncharacterized protein LOC123977590 isoform X2 n=1 Tax=Micropterus dolomieu TaxID=147949 RepID=UPI001E8D799F|nr:uncharacterized protein LOC123977590 isoform X2 [Micropterus dolomieu]
MIAVPTSSPLLAPFFREFFLVLNKVSYPEEVDVIVETLQGIFTRGSLQQHHELTLTTLRPGAPPVWLPQPKYGHTQMDPPPSFEPLQAQRIKKPAHCCVDVLRCVCGQGTTGQVDKASHEKWWGPARPKHPDGERLFPYQSGNTAPPPHPLYKKHDSTVPKNCRKTSQTPGFVKSPLNSFYRKRKIQENREGERGGVEREKGGVANIEK